MEELTLQELVDKIEVEGGLPGVLDWGGPEYFPQQLKKDAREADLAIKKLEKSFERLCEQEGIEWYY